MENRKQICNGTIYIVKEGDTIYKIAKKHDLQVDDIMKNNSRIDIFNLQIGTKLCLPLKDRNPIEKTYPYVVKLNQSLVQILYETNMTFEHLLEWNPILGRIALLEGSVLQIPIKK